jgi:hypothetical protein
MGALLSLLAWIRQNSIGEFAFGEFACGAFSQVLDL